MFTTGLSSDPNSLSGNLLDAMAKHTRAAINDTLRVRIGVTAEVLQRKRRNAPAA